MGRKKKREPQVSPEAQARLREALAALAAGRPPGEVAAGLARGTSPEQGLELAAALAGEDSEQAAELAAAGAEVFAARNVSRAFKRALYLLEQKGRKVVRRAEEPVLRRVAEPARLPAYVSLPDPAGHQMVIAAVPGRGGYDACLCGVSPEGVEDFILIRVPRKGLKELAAKVEEDSKLPIAETDNAHARLLLEEARDVSSARGRTVAPEFPPFLKALAVFAPRREEPPVYELLDAAQISAEPSLLERSPTLLEGIGTLWLLPAGELRPYVLRLEEAETSGLLLSRQQRQERLLDIFGRAARDLFDARRRRAWQRRLEESAYVLVRRGRLEEARIALAAAIDFAGEPGELRQNPLALGLVSRSLLPLVREIEAEEKDSLIIKPGGPLR